MPVGRGIGPSAVNQLFRDRSLRLATLLAVGIGIPVAIMFYFQFRSLSDLGQASRVVLRQLSQETADAITKDLQDALKAARADVLLKIFQYQTEPLDIPFIQTTFNQGLEADPFVDGFYVWSDATVEHRNELLFFDRKTRSFVTNPPETELVIDQFRSMAPAQRAIAVFEAPLNGRSTYFLAQLRFTFPSRDRLTSFVAMRVDAERLRTIVHPATGRQAPGQGRRADRVSRALRVGARQRRTRHLSGRRHGVEAVRRRADVSCWCSGSPT